jgi:hypothetical protein
VYDKAFRDPEIVKVTEFTDDDLTQSLFAAKEKLFVALIEGHLPAKASFIVENQRYYSENIGGPQYREVACEEVWEGMKSSQWENIEVDWPRNRISYAVPQPGAVNVWEREKLYIAKGVSVDTEKLFELFPDQSQKEKSAQNPAYVLTGYSTPYIDLMIRAIKELKISSAFQPKKKVIEHWLSKADPTLSGRDIKALATFLRLPELRKGGSEKKK